MPQSTLRLTLILGALTAFAPMSIDMYLPAMPAMERSLATDAAAVQLTLSTFFLGLAAGQLVYGPLSDRFGRKRPLLAGLLLYIAASAGCALAPTVETLIGLRLVQSLGGCAGVVIARAMVRDLFEQQQAARMFSLLVLVMGLAPILAPLAGSFVLELAGWRTIFWVLAAFGAICCTAAMLGLAESHPPQRRTTHGAAGAVRDYLALLRDRRYLGFALSGGLPSAGMFAYIAGSPVLFIEGYGLSPQLYGILFGTNAFGLIAASQINRRLLGRMASEAVLYRANLAAAGTATLLLLAAATGAGGLWGLLVPLFLYMSSLGFTMPNAQAGALAGQAARAGTAAALMGTVQFSSGALSASLSAALHDGGPLPMATAIACCAWLALAAQVFLVRRGRA